MKFAWLGVTESVAACGAPLVSSVTVPLNNALRGGIAVYRMRTERPRNRGRMSVSSFGMRKWFVLFLLLQLASCIATTALAHSVGTSMVVNDLVDTVGVNVWPDESSTFDATSTRYLDDGYGGTDLAEILGPRWSHQAGSVRLSRRVRDMKPGPVDLVVQILSTSGVRVTATANGTQLEESEFKEGRQRFRLPSVPAAGDLLVELECEVGVWRYRIPAPHFVGFDRRARAILGSAAVLP